MPLSGEAIRTMNYVDDISVTLRRILAVLPSNKPKNAFCSARVMAPGLPLPTGLRVTSPFAPCH